VKKPINKVALALWALAVLVVIGEACSFAIIQHGIQRSAATGDTVYLVVGGIWNMVRSTVISAGALVALGMMVELLDQIRRNTVRQD